MRSATTTAPRRISSSALRTVALAAALSTATAGCRGCRRSAADAAVARGDAARAATTASQRCARLDDAVAGVREQRAVRGRTLTREGPVVRDPGGGRDGAAVLAVLGGPHDGDLRDPRLRAIADAVRDADVIAVLGGLHGDAARLGAFADAVVPAGTPALWVPADTEDVSAFRAALATLAARRPELLDGTVARALLTRALEVVTVPGTPWPALLRARERGCGRVPEDVAALARALPAPAAPRVVLSAHAPAQRGAAAIDRGVMGTHVGDAALATALESLGARGVVALVPRESAGTLGDLAGARALPLAQDLGATRFALSVGSAGSDPLRVLDGTLRGPVAFRVRVTPAGSVVERIAP